MGRKGDVSTDLNLVECKTTGKKSISVHRDHLIKITREAKLVLKSPMAVYSFPFMPSDVDEDWVMLPLGALKALQEKLAESLLTNKESRI